MKLNTHSRQPTPYYGKEPILPNVRVDGIGERYNPLSGAVPAIVASLKTYVANKEGTYKQLAEQEQAPVNTLIKPIDLSSAFVADRIQRAVLDMIAEAKVTAYGDHNETRYYLPLDVLLLEFARDERTQYLLQVLTTGLSNTESVGSDTLAELASIITQSIVQSKGIESSDLQSQVRVVGLAERLLPGGLGQRIDQLVHHCVHPTTADVFSYRDPGQRIFLQMDLPVDR